MVERHVRRLGLALLVAAGACSGSSDGTSGRTLAVTVSGAETAELKFDQIYCMEMNAISDPSLRLYMISFRTAGEAFPILQGNLRQVTDPLGVSEAPQVDTDITLNLSASNSYVTVPGGELHDLATGTKTITLAPTTIDFECPCLDDGDTVEVQECAPQPLLP
jgi:hypothetical protein